MARTDILTRRSKSRYALLGLLSIRPMSGYDMKAFVEQSLAHFWKESYGSIYPLLRRLAEEGLVERTTKRRDGSPERHVYALTPDGRKALREWLEAPTEDEPVIRSELLLKVFFGANLDHTGLRSLLVRFRDQQKLRLEQLRAAEQKVVASRRKRQRDAVYWFLTVRRGLLVTEARVRWAEMALQDLSRAPLKAPGGGRRKRRIT